MWLALLLLVPMGVCASDEIYRVVQPDGSIRYTDKAPDKRARPMQLGPASGTTPTKGRTFYSPEALRVAARFAASMESPTPGQVVPADRVVAAASVMPGLVSGFRLVYWLNDRAITPEPVEDLSILLPPIEPGDHRLSVVVLNPQGQEVARSGEVSFRAKAP